MVSTTYKCLQCGAELKFNPQTQNWKCEYCDSAYSQADLQANGEKAQKSVETEAPEQTGESAEGDIVAYKCSYCGAEVVTSRDTSATFCIFCQRPVILENNLSGEFKPKYIIPFKNTKNDALAAFRQYTKKKLFLPDEFKKSEHIDKITGVYVPFWLFGGTVHFTRAGEGDVVTTWSDSKYRYTKTDTFGYAREGTISFEKIPVDASSSTDNNMMDSLEPFDYSEIKEFAIPYLSGFLAERFDESDDECVKRATPRMLSSTDTEIDKTIRYTTNRVHTNEHTFSGIVSEYALLPVWLLYTNFQEKSYLFAMNGQTGKFMGNLPIDRKKVLKYGLLCFLTSGAVSVLIAFLSLLS